MDNFALEELKKSYRLTNGYPELDGQLAGWGKPGTRAHGKIKGIGEEFDSYQLKTGKKWNPRNRPRLGFDAILELLEGKKNPIYLELGAELGSSAEDILETFEDATVISIDIWPTSHIPAWPELKNIITEPYYGPFSIYCNRLFKHKERIIPIKEMTTKGLKIVHDFGVEPDMIYVDAHHEYLNVWVDIYESFKLFPNAIMCGDDFETGEGVKEAVKDFCDLRLPAVPKVSKENEEVIKKFKMPSDKLEYKSIANQWIIRTK